MHITSDAQDAFRALLILMTNPKSFKKEFEDLVIMNQNNEAKLEKLYKYEADIVKLGKQIEDQKQELDTKLQESLKLYASQLQDREKVLIEDLDKASKLKKEYEDKLSTLKNLMNGG